jgi:hypothetical protein
MLSAPTSRCANIHAHAVRWTFTLVLLLFALLLIGAMYAHYDTVYTASKTKLSTTQTASKAFYDVACRHVFEHQVEECKIAKQNAAIDVLKAARDEALSDLLGHFNPFSWGICQDNGLCKYVMLRTLDYITGSLLYFWGLTVLCLAFVWTLRNSDKAQVVIQNGQPTTETNTNTQTTSRLAALWKRIWTEPTTNPEPEGVQIHTTPTPRKTIKAH